MWIDGLNYYEILEVSPKANQESIYSAYCEAKTTFNLSNPKIYNTFTPKEAQDWVELIDEAYSIIGFPNSRRQYDLELQSQLPSFEFCGDEDNKESQNREDFVPEGFGRTQFSQYEIIPAMEEIIKTKEICDGLFLKKIREYKKIDLTAFATVTCIAIRHLYAIENNNFSVLPAAVFVRGYIIQYCRVLGLDEEKVVPTFMTLFKDAR